MALGLKDLLREPAPIREEGINLCHCGQQPGRNCMPLGTCLRRAGVGLRARRGGCFGLKRLQRILKQSGEGQKIVRTCVHVCARACVHWVRLGSWMLPLCWPSICARARVRACALSAHLLSQILPIYRLAGQIKVGRDTEES